MIKKLFTVYDDKAESYMDPFCAQTKATALRDFTEVANNPESKISQHASDFHLIYLGEWDAHAGKFFAANPKVAMASALEVKTPKAPIEDLN